MFSYMFIDFSFYTLSFLHVCLRGMWMLRVGMGWGGVGHVNVRLHLLHEVDVVFNCCAKV